MNALFELFSNIFSYLLGKYSPAVGGCVHVRVFSKTNRTRFCVNSIERKMVQKRLKSQTCSTRLLTMELCMLDFVSE